MTALRAQDLNGHWHQTWKTLALVTWTVAYHH
jgi:hypothetical protein